MRNIITLKHTSCNLINRSLTLLSFLLLSCNPRQQQLNDYKMELVSKVQVDETELVHSFAPDCLTSIDDSSIACIVDDRIIAIYNTQTGALLHQYDCDTLIRQSGFRNEELIDRYLKGHYPGRQYIDDTADLNHRPEPRYMIVHIAGPARNGHLFLAAQVAVSYTTSMFILGKTLDVQVLDEVPALFSLDLKTSRINYMNYIDQHDFDTANDRSMYFDVRNGAYYQDGIFYGNIGPNATRVTPVPHFGIFDCRKERLSYSKVRSPETVHNTRYEVSISFLQQDSFILFNTFSEVYRMDKHMQQELIVSLKDPLNKDSCEYISAMGQVSGNLLLLETMFSAPVKSADSIRYYFFGYYLLDLNKKTFSRRILRHTARNFSSSTAFGPQHFIKFSKDEEHYYIETYRLHCP